MSCKLLTNLPLQGLSLFFLLVKANAGNRNADLDATKVEVAACCVLEMDMCAP